VDYHSQVQGVDRQPKNPFHPGQVLLEEFLEPHCMSQAAFAKNESQ
jgi:plasmid maintenance system antidote protein VapI